MIGLQFQGVAVSIGDEAVIAVVDQEGQLGVGRGLHPSDDETHRHSIGLTGEGSVAGFGHVGGALHPVRDGRPVLFRYGFDEIAQLGVWRTVMEKRTFIWRQTATMSDVGPHGERWWLNVAFSGSGPRRERCWRVPGAAEPSARRRCDGEQRVIAPLAGVVWRRAPGDGGVQVDGQRIIARSGTGAPGSGQRLTGAAARGPNGNALNTAQHLLGPASAQRVDRRCSRHRPGPTPPYSGPQHSHDPVISQVNVAVAQTQVMGRVTGRISPALANGDRRRRPGCAQGMVASLPGWFGVSLGALFQPFNDTNLIFGPLTLTSTNS